MRKILLTLTVILLSTVPAFADSNDGFDAYNLYSSHGVMGSWGSGSAIAGALILGGWSLRLIVILVLAATGRDQNVVLTVGKLLAAGIGMYVLQGLI